MLDRSLDINIKGVKKRENEEYYSQNANKIEFIWKVFKPFEHVRKIFGIIY